MEIGTILLTEDEAATRLRCAVGKIQRLRLSGALPYLPGRPPLIRLADLEAYIDARVTRADVNPAGAERLENEKVRRRAAQAHLKMRMRERGRGRK